MRNGVILCLVTMALLPGCESATLDWTPTEAPKTIRVDTAVSSYDVGFAAGDSSLSDAEAARLAAFIAAGGVRPADRITLSGADSDPTTAEARRNRVTAALRRQGVGAMVAIGSTTNGRPDRLTVRIERAVATLPNCPNWSKPPVDYTGAVSSNFGCADVTNLGLMIADPADLAGGRPTGLTDAAVTTAAAQRYRDNQAFGSPQSTGGSFGVTPVPGSGASGGQTEGTGQ